MTSPVLISALIQRRRALAERFVEVERSTLGVKRIYELRGIGVAKKVEEYERQILLLGRYLETGKREHGGEYLRAVGALWNLRLEGAEVLGIRERRRELIEAGLGESAGAAAAGALGEMMESIAALEVRIDTYPKYLDFMASDHAVHPHGDWWTYSLVARELLNLSEELGESAVVVDNGCGAGMFEKFLLGRKVPVSALAVDVHLSFSEDFYHSADRVVGALMDGHGLALGDSSVDVFVSNFVLEHVRDPLLYLQEMHRALRPGGRVLATVPTVSWYAAHLCNHLLYFDYLRSVRRDLAGFLEDPLGHFERHFLHEHAHEKVCNWDGAKREVSMLDEIGRWRRGVWESFFERSGFEIKDRKLSANPFSLNNHDVRSTSELYVRRKVWSCPDERHPPRPSLGAHYLGAAADAITLAVLAAGKRLNRMAGEARLNALGIHATYTLKKRV